MSNGVKMNFTIRSAVAGANSEESRPVKLVQEKENVWRIVYAD
jgi:hypothetical protein